LSKKNKKNRYNNEILRQSYQKDMPKRVKDKLTLYFPPIDLCSTSEIVISNSDYSELLILLWDNRNYNLPIWKKERLRELVKKYKISLKKKERRLSK